MQMSLQEAIKYLEMPYGYISEDLTKNAYRKCCSKYHPDKNPNSLEQMKLINVAYKTLKCFAGYISMPHEEPKKEEKKKTSDKEIKLANIINWVNSRNLDYFIDDGVMWIYGKTYPYKEILKEFKFRWNPDEKMWHRDDLF